MESLFLRLKERKLFQWVLAYAAGAWVLLEVTDFLAQQFLWPLIIVRALTLIAIFGFFVVLILAWYHGEKGRQRVSGVELLMITVVMVIAGAALWTLEPMADESTVGDVSAPPIPDREGVAIAVLPLENLSPDPDDAFFSAGMHEELITRLQNILDIIVISRTSVMRYAAAEERPSAPEIGRDLRVDYIIEGSARRDLDQVRVTLQLIRAESDEPLWAQDYDRPWAAGSLLEIQRDVAERVANSLHLVLTPQEQAQIQKRGTNNDQAYQAYLTGLYYQRSDPRSPQALTQFERAVELDPDFAEGWAAVATSNILLRNRRVLTPGQAFPAALAAAERAMGLDSTVAEARLAVGSVHFSYRRDWEAAGREWRRALELKPSLPEAHRFYAQWLQVMGRFDEAVERARYARSLDPLSANSAVLVARMLRQARQPHEAVERFESALALFPDDVRLLAWLGVTLVEIGRVEEGLLHVHRYEETGRNDKTLVATVYAMIGDTATAGEILRELEGGRPLQFAGFIALIYGILGDPDRAFEWLDRAYDEYDSWLFQLNEPLWDPIRDDPRFTALLRRLNLPG